MAEKIPEFNAKVSKPNEEAQFQEIVGEQLTKQDVPPPTVNLLQKFAPGSKEDIIARIRRRQSNPN